MKKPFDNKKPFAPSEKAFGAFRSDSKSRGPQDGSQPWRKSQPGSRGGEERSFGKPDWKKDRPEGGRDDKPAWKKDRPSFGDRPSYGGGSDRPAYGRGPAKPGFGGSKPGYGGSKPSFGGGKPAWQKDRPDSGDRPGRPAWQKDRPDSGDRPSRPAWQKDRPAFSADSGRPAWKKDRPEGGAGGARPTWNKDRPSYNPGPGAKPRKSYQQPSSFRDDRGPSRGDDRPREFNRPERSGGFREDGPRKFGAGPGGSGGGYKRPGDFRTGGAPKPAWKSDRPSWQQRDQGGAATERREWQPRPQQENREWKPRQENREWQPRPPQEKREWQPRESQPERREWQPSSREQQPADEHVESSATDVNEYGGRESISVPSNKVNPSDGYRPAPRKPQPFVAPRVSPDAPTARPLVVTLEDTNNVPTRIVWVYDSMVGQLPEGDPYAGDTVFVYDDKNRFLGSAIYNPNSRIRARIFSLTRKRFDQDYIGEAMAAAISRRKRQGIYNESCRVIFGESDGLPGLIADKIGDYLVIQPLTYAVDRNLKFIIDRLNELVSPAGIVVRKDVPIRAKEGLSVEAPELHGEIPDRVKVTEGGFTVFANVNGGQKTGLFLDQRFNREVIKPYCKDARVLDLFCHVGGWALAAASYGASEVVGVDTSKSSLEMAKAGAEASGFNNISFVDEDVFEYLRSDADTGLFDVIICDPPAFAKTRQHYEEAFRAYLSLNYLVMKKLKPGGILVTCSCSQALSITEFNEAILTSARNARMQFQVIKRLGAPADHPVLLGLPETEYLKCFVLERTE